MAPKAKAKGKAKGKAKANATVKEPKSPAKSGGGDLDLVALQQTLQRWNDAKKQEDAAKKEIEACKTQVESTLIQTGMTVIKTASFEVSKRTQTREGVSKADLPADIFKKYAKTSEFTVLTLKDLAKKGKKA
mmetsp:Transcript_99997/g.322415  ORF Transcript_99997/g.322415 Transcript_99997/m.322415 type:complete len:132 (-) Transcript_99997:85-480(-)